MQKDSYKKDILFVCMGLGIGGTEKTLVEAVNCIDKEKHNVSVYLRKNRTDLVKYINPEVQIIVNEGSLHVENDTYCRIGKVLERVSRGFGLYRLEKYVQRKVRIYVLERRRNHEILSHFKDKKYDFAVAYDMANECISLVTAGVQADKKIAFYHASDLYASKAELYRSFDKIVGVNSLVAQNIIENYSILGNKVTAIENYMSPEWVFSELEQSNMINPPEADLLLCSCGRITSGKGFDLAVKAAIILRDSGIDFHWYFVGDGPDREKIEKLIETNGVGDYITITGFESRPFNYMNICDIYVQPSEGEAHATTMVEAQILGKPMVSTDTIAGKYFSDMYKSCILAEKKPEDLSKKIIDLYRNNELQAQIVLSEKNIDYDRKRVEYSTCINELFD